MLALESGSLVISDLISLVIEGALWRRNVRSRCLPREDNTWGLGYASEDGFNFNSWRRKEQERCGECQASGWVCRVSGQRVSMSPPPLCADVSVGLSCIIQQAITMLLLCVSLRARMGFPGSHLPSSSLAHSGYRRHFQTASMKAEATHEP